MTIAATETRPAPIATRDPIPVPSSQPCAGPRASTYNIQVTQAHIQTARRGDSAACAIAAAAQAAGLRIRVGQDAAEVTVAGCAATLELPQQMKEFVAKFDAGEPVEPFSFQIWLQHG